MIRKLNGAVLKKEKLLSEMAKPKTKAYLDSDDESVGSPGNRRSTKLMSQSCI